MKRSIFLLITALLGFLFGGLMLISPFTAASQFGLATTPEILLLLRVIGGFIACIGVLNLLVKNEGDSAILRSVLIFNALSHLLSMLIDLSGIVQGFIQYQKTMSGNIVHLFVFIGCLYYLNKMNKKV